MVRGCSTVSKYKYIYIYMYCVYIYTPSMYVPVCTYVLEYVQKH